MIREPGTNRPIFNFVPVTYRVEKFWADDGVDVLARGLTKQDADAFSRKPEIQFKKGGFPFTLYVVPEY